MRHFRGIALLAVSLLLVSCVAKEKVVFVTSTELGIGADPSMGNVNIGYDRNELVISPGYPETGGVPPVYAKLETDMAVINPSVKQLYATGDAARAAVGTDLPDTAFDDDLYGNRKLLVFGTTTNFGLKIQSINAGTPAVNLGYKRKEFSVIPLRETEPTQASPDHYASTLAGIELRGNIQNASNPEVQGRQFIATGSAANRLASSPEVRELFAKEARKALNAVNSIPVANSELQAKIKPLCDQQRQRGSDPQLNAKLTQVEASVGFSLATYCAADPAMQAASYEKLSAAAKTQGLL